jgi:hypothetical protein
VIIVCIVGFFDGFGCFDIDNLSFFAGLNPSNPYGQGKIAKSSR